MADKPQFLSAKQLISWCKYMVDVSLIEENDLSMARIMGELKSRRAGHAAIRNMGAMRAATLATRFPNQYTAWCVRERVAGRLT